MTTKLLSSNQPETINLAYCRDLHPAKSLGCRIPSNIPNASSHCADAPSYPGRSQGQCEALRSIVPDHISVRAGRAVLSNLLPHAPMPIEDTHCPATSTMTFPEKWPSIGDMPWRLQHATGAKPTQTSHHGTQFSHVGIAQEAIFFQGPEEVMLICKKPKHFYELRRVIAMACGIPTVGQTMIGVVGK